MVVLAHRGSAWPWPENTLAAFAWARALGADGVELDVHATADGIAVVHHDAEVPFVGPIAALPAGALPRWVPSLEAALSLATGCAVNVEVKAPPPGAGGAERTAGATATALRRRGLVGAGAGRRGSRGSPEGWPAVVVSSFSLRALEAVRDAAEGVAIAWLTPPGADLLAGLDTAARLGMAGLHPHHGSLGPSVASVVEEAHQRGLRLCAWTVDDPEQAVAFARAGVDAIVTNRVRAVLAALRLVRGQPRRGQSRA
jgi:glycerophosphoryl diester phosphodiesterase